MRTTLIAVSASATMLILPLAISAQTCPTGPGLEITPAYQGLQVRWTGYFTALTRLGNQFVSLYDGDSLTEPLWLTGGAVSSLNGTGFHETWYIPKYQITNTAPFFRLYSGPPANSGQGGSSIYDHMDSPYSNEGYPDYGVDFKDQYGNPIPHGYPWTVPPSGTLPLTRYLNLSIFDHTIYLHDLTARHILDAQVESYPVDASYDTGSGSPRYGFQRFNTCLGNDPAMSRTLGSNLSNGTLSIHFNPVWGNAIDGITHVASNRQLIDPAIGAMAQAVIRFSLSCPTCTRQTCDSCDSQVFGVSPGDAGGVGSGPQYGVPTLWAGSPTTAITTGSNFVQTELKPLSFEFDIAPGGDPDNPNAKTDVYSPLMWRGTFRRTTQLGYTAGGITYPNIIKVRNEVKEDSGAAHVSSYNLNHTFFFPEQCLFGDPDCPYPHPANFGPPSAYTIKRYAVLGWHTLDFDWAQPPTLRQNTQFAPQQDEAIVIATNADDPSSSFAVGVMALYATADPFAIFGCANGPPASLCDQVNYHNSGGGVPELIVDTFRGSLEAVNASTYTPVDAYLAVGSLAEVSDQLQRVVCQEKGLCGGPAQFYTVTPCRVADTRNPPGPAGGPAMAAGATRTFQVANNCDVPTSAKAAVINLAVVDQSAGGYLRVYPPGQAAPLTSAINFQPGGAVANNVTIALGAGGQLTIECGMASGSTDLVLDVYGYFQ